MLGEPISMLVPQVVGLPAHRQAPRGRDGDRPRPRRSRRSCAALGVVGKFVEFFGRGLVGLPLADRATIANMAPEYGATCGFFPVDEETLRYLRLTGRSAEQVELVEAYCREQGLFHDPDDEPDYTQVVELDLGDVEPSLAGPRRPQDRVPLPEAKASFLESLSTFGVALSATAPRTRRSPTRSRPAIPRTHRARARAVSPTTSPEPVAAASPEPRAVPVSMGDPTFELEHGAVVIAAITSCTNTSNPAVMVARRAAREERGRARPRPQAVGQVEPRAGLQGRHRVPTTRRG